MGGAIIHGFSVIVSATSKLSGLYKFFDPRKSHRRPLVGCLLIEQRAKEVWRVGFSVTFYFYFFILLTHLGLHASSVCTILLIVLFLNCFKLVKRYGAGQLECGTPKIGSGIFVFLRTSLFSWTAEGVDKMSNEGNLISGNFLYHKLNFISKINWGIHYTILSVQRSIYTVTKFCGVPQIQQIVDAFQTWKKVSKANLKIIRAWKDEPGWWTKS